MELNIEMTDYNECHPITKVMFSKGFRGNSSNLLYSSIGVGKQACSLKSLIAHSLYRNTTKNLWI